MWKPKLPSWLRRQPSVPRAPRSRRHTLIRVGTGAAAAVVIFLLGLGWYWSREPGIFWVNQTDVRGHPTVVGYATVDTLIQEIDFLLDKPGGYLSNDVMPPGRSSI